MSSQYPQKHRSFTLVASLLFGLLPLSAQATITPPEAKTHPPQPSSHTNSPVLLVDGIWRGNLAIPRPLLLSFKERTVPQNRNYEDDYPPTRATGGRPGECGENSNVRGAVYPLTPSENVLTTLDPTPKIYLSLPALQNQQAEFRLFDESYDKVYQTLLTLNNEAGLVSLELPEKAALQPETIYLWEFSIICDPEDLELNESVAGWLHQPNVNAPSVSSPLQQIQYYQEEGIWYEAFEMLLEMRDSQPQAWEALLEAVGLEEYKDQPVVDTLTLE